MRLGRTRFEMVVVVVVTEMVVVVVVAEMAVVVVVAEMAVVVVVGLRWSWLLWWLR